jgi:hypothetical protein
MSKIAYFILGVLLGMVAMWLLLAYPLKAEATWTHKSWDYYWEDWSECQPQTEVLVREQEEYCGTVEGKQYRNQYKECVYDWWGTSYCTLGDVDWVDYEEQSCKIEYDPCPEPTPEPTPTPEPGEPVTMWSPPDYHAPECAGIGAPKQPTLQLLEVLGNGEIKWRLSQSDPYDKALFSYGYTPSNLEFGIPDLGVNNQSVVEFVTNGLIAGNHVWGQVVTGRNECYSYSDVIDPVIK